MIKNDVIYGIEVLAQDGNAPGVFLTFSGRELKAIIKFLSQKAEILALESEKEDRGLTNSL